MRNSCLIAMLTHHVGRASVYTLNGTLKSVFLRVSYDGTYVCQPDSLEVPSNLSLTIYVEQVSSRVVSHSRLRSDADG